MSSKSLLAWIELGLILGSKIEYFSDSNSYVFWDSVTLL